MSDLVVIPEDRFPHDQVHFLCDALLFFHSTPATTERSYVVHIKGKPGEPDTELYVFYFNYLSMCGVSGHFSDFLKLLLLFRPSARCGAY